MDAINAKIDGGKWKRKHDRFELHHVLDAMQSLACPYSINTAGRFEKWNEKTGTMQRLEVGWFFPVPLHLQSPETISFLHSILCV